MYTKMYFNFGAQVLIFFLSHHPPPLNTEKLISMHLHLVDKRGERFE